MPGRDARTDRQTDSSALCPVPRVPNLTGLGQSRGAQGVPFMATAPVVRGGDVEMLLTYQDLRITNRQLNARCRPVLASSVAETKVTAR